MQASYLIGFSEVVGLLQLNCTVFRLHYTRANQTEAQKNC